MNLTEQGIAAYLGEERLKYIQTVTIGIAGAGGLGSNCAMHLVRSGFKQFVLVDFDQIEKSNLNRQSYTLKQLDQYKVTALSENMLAVNPALDLDVLATKVTLENMQPLFDRCDAVVEAFDDPKIKRSFVETFLSTEKLVVAASGIGGTGNADAIITRKVRDNFYIIGDMVTECSAKQPPFSPKVAIAAAKQADVILSYYLDKFETEGGAK
ncbi:sulfur carrier protein ThiS adenylyltransferase [Maridesulfovibrio ferrireducens]|uniref:Sulfur carrier protein ThiS adenylyltransferase n=1 Tax=Maridesulfovibrio ferrireducens TaxID=246191 RepID=A0A1G9FVZ3_9BACT|nr:sulfur carrier protein ThiS adenylyltransferase ThiF [Maridesulfovibrio ferrireducens]SDK92505.1 sulfur carrier protein ThiS adenylyltransferase [Maridesulfovibrio ferrireducens]